MPAGYGLSFQPGAENGNNGKSRVAPVQEAIRLLSLRLPTVVGARGISPQALLEGQGGAGLGGGGSVEALIRQLLQQMQMPPQLASQGGGGRAPVSGPPAQPGQPRPTPQFPSRSLPKPSITPGQQTGEGPRQDVPLPAPFIDPRPAGDAPARARELSPYERYGGQFNRQIFDEDSEYHRG